MFKGDHSTEEIRIIKIPQTRCGYVILGIWVHLLCAKLPFVVWFSLVPLAVVLVDVA